MTLLSAAILSILLLLACTSSSPTTAQTGVAEVFRESYGAAPAAGWKWGVAEITTGAEERIEANESHGFAWVFYVVRGSIEIGTAEGKKVIPAGKAVIVPARQGHTHRFLPQSQVLVFRPADRPFGEFHRGARLYESDKPMELKAGQDYAVRIREFTLAPKSQGMTVESSFGYVLAGTLNLRLGDTASAQPAGKAFGLPADARQVLSNEGATPVRVILVDLK